MNKVHNNKNKKNISYGRRAFLCLRRKSLTLLVIVTAVLILLPCATQADTETYQKGDGKGTTSETDDSSIESASSNMGTALYIGIDGDPHWHSVIKFPNIFGSGANQIPLGSTINSATLTLEVSDEGDNVNVYQLIESWTETDVTWNSRTSTQSWTSAGADGTGSRYATAVGTISAGTTGTKNVTVTTTLQNWSDGEANEGWVLTDTGTGGVDIRLSEYGTASVRPKLTVDFTRLAGIEIGLVGHWPLDENPAIHDTTVVDDSGQGNNGTLSTSDGSTNKSVTGQIGQALSLDGVNDYVGVPNLASTLGSTATLAFWIKTTFVSEGGTPGGNGWDWGALTATTGSDSSTDVYWGLIDYSGKIGIELAAGHDPQELLSANPINDNQWHHIVITRNSSNGAAQVFVDGSLSNSGTIETGDYTSYAMTWIGHGHPSYGEYISGSLDDVRIYNRVLNQSDITELYNYTGAPYVDQANFQFFESGDELPHYDPGTCPVIEAGDITGTSDTSAGTTFDCAYPATVDEGDLIIFVVGKDDDPAITDNTGGLTEINKGNEGGGYGPYLFVGYIIADGDEDGTDHQFGGDSEEFQGFSIRVPTGEFDATRPIDSYSAMGGSSTSNDPNADTPEFTCGRAGGRVVAVGAVDTDPMDDPFSPEGYTDRADVDAGAVTAFIATRDAATTAAETIATAAFGINTYDSNTTLAFVVNAPATADGRTAIGAAGADPELDVDTSYGWQFRLENAAVESDDEYKLQYKHIEGTNTWTDITDASDVIIAILTADFANGDDVPEFVKGDGTYTTDNNAALESTGALTLAANLAANNSFEGHLNFQIVSSDVSDNDTVQLRVVYGDGTALEAYTDTPTISASGGTAVPAPYDETYTLDTLAGAEADWDFVGPDLNDLQVKNTDGAWCWTATGSTSGSTGPPSGVACVYTETSNPVTGGDEFFMTLTNPVDAGAYELYVTFDRCTYGDTDAHLYFEAYKDSTWWPIDDWAGDGTTTFTSEGPYDFTTYTNSDFKIRFRTVVGGTTYLNDMSVDTVRIYGDSRGGGATTTIGDGNAPADKGVAPDSTNNAVNAFTLVTNTEPETVTALTVTFTGTDVSDVASSGVKIYEDDGGTANKWDATDTLIDTTSFSGDTASFSPLSISVDSTPTQYLVTYDIAAGATETNTLQGAITDATVTNTLANNDKNDATLTISDCAFSYRKEITIQSSQVVGSSNHLNFPVLISLSGNWLKTTAVDSTNGRIENDPDGYDIIFKDTGGTQLDHEIEDYDGSATGGTLVAWVRIPILDHDDDTVIYMYYGNPCIDSSTENITGVWDDKYMAVWHLKETPTVDSYAYDSTSYDNHGTFQAGMTSGDQVSGRINGAIDFDGVDDGIIIPASDTLDILTAGTVEFWVKFDLDIDSYTDFTRLVDRWNGTSGGHFFVNIHSSQIRVSVSDGSSSDFDLTSISFVKDTWYHFTFVWDVSAANDMTFYVDGSFDEENDSGFSGMGDDNVDIGIAALYGGEDMWFDGSMDEVRISDTDRSSDWIETEYNNQKANSIFYIEGDEDDLGDCSYAFYKPITIKSDEVWGSSDHTDFPFLVNISKDNDLSGHVENIDGYDIIFRDSYGRQLDHEIEGQYEPTTGKFVAWVRIPTLSYNTDMVIYMYYGNSCISASQENVTGVWNSNYKGVWHLADTTTSGHELDSTSNDNHGLNAWNAEAEDFDDITDWLTDAAYGVYTIEENPSGQLHLLSGNSSGTDSSASVYKINTAYEGNSTYTIECRVKFDVLNDFTANGDGLAIAAGNYRNGNDYLWAFMFYADRIHSYFTDTLIVSRTFNTGQWYTFRFVVTDDDDVAFYEDGTYVTTANDISIDGDNNLSYLALACENYSTSPATTEAHVDWVRVSTATSGFGATRIDGRIDGSLDFDGTADNVNIPHHASIDFADESFSYSMWIKGDIADNTTENGNRIFSKGTSSGGCGNGKRYELYVDAYSGDDDIEFTIDDASAHTKTGRIASDYLDTTWHYITYTRNVATNEIEIYLDGSPDGTTDTDGSGDISNGCPLFLAAENEGDGEIKSGRCFNGTLDEFRISDTPRSAGWIKTCYYNQKAGSTFYSIDPEEEYAPTAVDLISFTATGQDESVLVEWETAQEIDNLGFNLYCSTELGGTYSKLNSSLIPGLISSVSGQQYTYIDRDVTRDVLYYYMLEDVDLSGTRTMHGPVCVDWDGDGIPDDYDEQADDDDSDDDADDGPEVRIPELRFEEVDFGPEGWTPSSSYASWVKLSSFRARQGDEGIALEWETSFEVDNFGFHVYRELDGKFYRITPDLMPGSVFKVGAGRELPAGQSYMYWDGLSEGTGHELYWLDCVELNGGRASFGPIKPEIYAQPVSERLKVRFKSITRHQVSRARALGKARELREELSTKPIQTQSSSATFRTIDPEKPSEPRLQPNEEQWVLSAQSGVKIYIREDGWYRVGEPELVAAGLSPGVDPRYLQLYADGEEKSMMVTGSDDGRFDPEDAVEFYGTGLDTSFTAAHVYWLVVGSRPGRRVDTPFIDIRLDLGKRMRVPRGLRGRGAPLSFPFSLELKERTFYFAALKNGERENFFGSVISTEPVDQLLTVAHPDLSSPEDAVLEVVLQGATDSTHQIKILFNYVEVGELGFSRQERRAVEIQVPYDLLLEGDNIVTLTAQGGSMDVSLVDKIRLTYWRTYTADEDFLQFKTSGGEWLSIGGFSSSEIQVVDITDPMRMINIRGKVMTQDSGYAITVKVPSAGERTLLAFTEDKIKSPAGIEANLASSWHEINRGADVIIIGHSDLLESVEFLKQLREQQGWSVVLVDVEDLYDEFNFGAKSPWALKDFLDRAYAFWNPHPRFVLLVGDTSYDPRSYLGFGKFDLVPTKFVDTVYLNTASDDWFVDFDDDGLPEMAVGRLPVESAEEAATVVSKIITYEGVAGLMYETLLVADINDSIDFEGASADVAEELLEGSMEVTEILRGRSATARSDLLNLLNQGQLLVNYFGHGSTKTWNGNLLTSLDAWNLTNSPYLPFLVSMTCLNGFFQDPYSESLAEAFLKAEQGGAIAVWTSSGLTLPTEQAVMNLELIRLLFNGEGLTIGEAVMRAKRAVTNGDIRRTWILFGDPTLRLR